MAAHPGFTDCQRQGGLLRLLPAPTLSRGSSKLWDVVSSCYSELCGKTRIAPKPIRTSGLPTRKAAPGVMRVESFQLGGLLVVAGVRPGGAGRGARRLEGSYTPNSESMYVSPSRSFYRVIVLVKFRCVPLSGADTAGSFISTRDLSKFTLLVYSFSRAAVIKDSVTS